MVLELTETLAVDVRYDFTKVYEQVKMSTEISSTK